MDKQARDVSPAEIRRDTEALLDSDPSDNLTWLVAERNLEAALRGEASQVEDKVGANRHDERVQRFADSANELKSLRDKVAAMTTLLNSRLLVSLTEATRPEWRATHKHYKGGYYRALGPANDANGEELVEGIVYDDHRGQRYFLHRDKFESVLESGRPRYQVLLKDVL